MTNFDPIHPKTKTPVIKEPLITFGTPQPVRTENMLRNEAFISCFNKLVFK